MAFLILPMCYLPKHRTVIACSLFGDAWLVLNQLVMAWFGVYLMFVAGHAECVRFVKKLNLPLLVCSYLLQSLLAVCSCEMSKLTWSDSPAGYRRWGIHKRECCSMLDCWDRSSLRHRTTQWYANVILLSLIERKIRPRKMSSDISASESNCKHNYMMFSSKLMWSSEVI